MCELSLSQSRPLRAPPHDECDMTAKQSGVCVQLVDDDEFEIAKEPAPRVFSRQDGQVEHVRVRENLSSPVASASCDEGKQYRLCLRC